MKIIGQEKLLKKLDTYTILTLPKTILLIGEAGSGKSLIASYLAEKFKMATIDIDEKITPDDLIEYSRSNIKTFYLVDLNKFPEKQQASLLKSIEEPGPTMYFILMANSEVGILPTILNRCIKYNLDSYTIDQLKEFEWMIGNNIDDRVFKICKTPGKLNEVNTDTFNALYTDCENILNNYALMSYGDLIRYSLKINYKEDYNKYSFNLFLDTLEYISYNLYMKSKRVDSFNAYEVINKYKQQLVNKVVNKENFILNFLTALWERGQVNGIK